MRAARKSGFSLVEVALALMVVGVGMVAVFSVLPAGLDANKKAIDDAQEALFADEVFNGLRAKAQVTPWSTFDSVTLDQVVPDKWKPQSTPISAGSGGTHVAEAADIAVIDYAIRYVLTIENVSPSVKSVRLLVRNGQYGPMQSPSLYYTEIRRPGS